MAKVNDLLVVLNNLPKGYISKKMIHGKKYFYLQQVRNGKMTSVYIKKPDLKPLKEKLARRKAVEKEIEDSLSKEKNVNSLSPKTLELTGYVMSKNQIVAEFHKGQLVRLNDKLAPLIIKRTHSLIAFLSSRVMDTSRTNARLLKRVLNIHSDDDYLISLKNHATSLTDNYWFKNKNSRLKYKDVSLESDIYNEVALKGELLYIPKIPKLSPQYSLLGSYEKCWKLIDNEWWMYKVGTKEERYSEYISALISKKLGIPTAEYELVDNYIRSKNFAAKHNFEPLSALCGGDDSYDHVFNTLYDLDKELARQYLVLIWFDALVNNVDRHNENVGFLRSKKSGAVISLAPNYDLNMSLFARNPLLIKEKDGFISLYLKFVNKNKKAKELYQSMSPLMITEENINDVLSNVDLSEYDFDLKEYLLFRYNIIKDVFK